MGHQEVTRAWLGLSTDETSPAAHARSRVVANVSDSIGVPQRRHGWPVRP